MKLKNWWQTRKLWLRSGIIGIGVCGLLSVFYIFVYFPVIRSTVTEEKGLTWEIILPTATGHIFPFLSGFIVPYGFLCDFSETICTGWQAEDTGSGESWQLESGEYGYCMNKTKVPTTACADFSEKVGFWGLTILLFVAYFAVGALTGYYLDKRKLSARRDLNSQAN